MPHTFKMLAMRLLSHQDPSGRQTNKLFSYVISIIVDFLGNNMTLEGRVERLGLAEMENAIQIEQSRQGVGGRHSICLVLEVVREMCDKLTHMDTSCSS